MILISSPVCKESEGKNSVEGQRKNTCKMQNLTFKDISYRKEVFLLSLNKSSISINLFDHSFGSVSTENLHLSYMDVSEKQSVKKYQFTMSYFENPYLLGTSYLKYDLPR